jgi:hypothetical protein
MLIAIKRFLGVSTFAAVAVTMIGCGAADDAAQAGNDQITNPSQESSGATSDDLSSGSSNMLLMGGTKGNGGDAVVCFSGTLTRDQVQEQLQRNRHERVKINPFKNPEVMKYVSSIEILDLFQYRLPSGFPPTERKLIAVNGTFDQELSKVVNRLKTISGLGAKLESTLAEIPVQSWRQAEAVVEIDDSAEVFFLPPECLLVQAAVRQESQIFYDAYLWNRMDELNRLGLVVHELIYKIGADRSQSTSEKARQIVGLVMSENELFELNGFELYERFKSLGDFSFIHQVGASKVQVSKVISQHLNGLPKEVISPEESELKIGSDRWRLGPTRGAFNLELAEDGRVQSMRGYCPSCSWADLRYPVKAQFAGEKLARIQTDGDHRLRLGLKGKDWTDITVVEMDVFGQLMKVQGRTSFESNLGHVEVSGTVLVDADGNITHASSGKLILDREYEGQLLVFDAEQNLIEFRNVHQIGQCTDSYFKHEDVSVRICDADLIFYPSGSLRSIEFEETLLVKLGALRWRTELRMNNDVYGISHLDFSEDGSTIRGRANKHGYYAYSESSQFHRVELMDKSIELKDGQLTVLP